MPDGSHLPVILAPEPFAPRVERLEACEGQSIAQILTAAVRGGHLAAGDLPLTVVFIDGVELEDRAAALDLVPRPGQVVNIAVVPQGGGKGKGNKVLQTILTIAIIAVSFWIGGPAGPLAAIGKGFTNVLVRTAAAAAVSTAGAALNASLFGPKAPEAEAAREARYSLQGQANQLRRGRMMPLVLGRRRVWFDVASSAYSETVGEDVYLHVIYGLHYGPCALDEASLKLGETLVSSLGEGDVEYELALTPGPRNFTLYPMRVVEDAYTDELTAEPDQYVVHTTAEDTEKIQIDASWPGGLFYVNEKGATLPYDAHLHVRYRAVGDTEWINAPLGPVSGPAGPLLEGSIYIKTQTKDALNVTREWSVPKGQYEVAVKKVGPQPTLEGNLTNTVFWAAMRSVENRKPIVDETLACVAMKVKATSTINGQLPQVSGVVTPICPVYADGGWETEAETSNPAALVRWLLTGPAAAKPMSPGQIDSSCAAAFDLITEREWEASVLLADDASQEDALLRLGRAGRFSTYWNGSKLCFVTDWEKPFPRQMFTGRNVKGYRYRRTFPDPIHAVRVQFENLDEDSRPDELVVFNDGYTAANADLYETLDLGMAVTANRAYREGRVYLAKAALHVEGHEWTSGLDGVASTFGDRVRVRHPSALYGAAEGRVTFRRWSGALVSGVRLDEAVTFDAGQDYAMDVRRPDGVMLGLALVNPGTTTRDIVFASPLTEAEAPGRGDLVAVGVVEQVTEDLEIIDITPTSGGEVQFVARAYKAEDIMAAETGEIPPLQTDLSTKAGAPKPRIRGAKGSPDGVVVYFDVAQQRTSPVRGFTARWRFTPGTGEDSNWRDLPPVGAAAREVRTPPITEAAFDPDGEFEGLRVDVEIRTALENGDVSEAALASSILIARDVPGVSNFAVLGVIRQAPDGTSYPVAQVYAAPMEGGVVQDLMVQFRPASGGDWQSALTLPAHAPSGDFAGVLGGETYDFRARWRATDGWVGPWSYQDDVYIPPGGFISTGVSKIGGYTPAELVDFFEGVSAQGASLTAAVLEAYLRLDDERDQLLTEVMHNGRRVKRVLIDEDEFWDDDQLSLWTRTKKIAVLGPDGQSMILQKDTLLWDFESGETMASHLDAVVSQIGDDIASAIEETKTWVNSESAGAQYLQQLQVTFGSWEGSITTLAEVNSDFGAAWTLALNVEGHVSGITSRNTGTTSSLIFLADEIGFTDGYSEVYPLAIVGGVVKATNFEVDRVKAGSIITESLVGGAVTSLSADTEAAATAIAPGPISALTHTHYSSGATHIALVFCTVAQTSAGESGVTAVVYCNGVEVGRGSTSFGGPFSHTIPIGALHTPGAGAANYQVTCSREGGSTATDQHVRTTIIVIELKK